MQPTLDQHSARYLLARAIENRGVDDSTAVLVNTFGAKMPEGMRVESIGPHRFVAMHDLAYYAVHGRIKED